MLKKIKMNKDIDCALVIAPLWGVTNPPIGLSHIKSIANLLKIKSKCFDFNIDLYNLSKNRDPWDLNFYAEEFYEIVTLNNVKKKYGKLINKWTDKILKHNPKTVGFAIYQSTVIMSLLIAQSLKQKNPNLMIFGGGLQLSDFNRYQDRLLYYFNYGFDYLLTKNSKEIYDFLKSFLIEKTSLKNISGIIYLENKKIKQNKNKPSNFNLLTKLIPCFDDFDFKKYLNDKNLPVNFSYGCTNQCSFCIDSLVWKGFQTKTGKQMYDEIMYYIYKYPKFKHFNFTDSLINGAPKELEIFCDLIIKSNKDIHWNAKARFDSNLTKELLIKMKLAGCLNLDFGLESGSQKILNDMNKNITLDVVKRILKDCTDIGINSICFVMIGYPTETEKDFDLTLKFIKENHKNIYQIGQTTACYVVKSSLIDKQRKKLGIVDDIDGWSNKNSTPEIRKKRAEKIQKLVKKLYGVYRPVQLH